MINNGGKSGGNPYHDENGHFTSKGNQGSAQPKSDPIVDFNRSLWDTYFGGQPQMPKKKTTGEKVLNQMGLTNEEVMETHKEKSDQKALDDLGEKMNKLEEETEYDDIDADYERSYGPVNSPEKYETYQKWLENGHSFDNIGGEEEQGSNYSPRYDSVKMDSNNNDAEVTFEMIAPVYPDDTGGEHYNLNLSFNDIVEELLSDYMTDEELNTYETKPLTEEFVKEMLDKYFDKANDDFYEKSKDKETWLRSKS